MKGEGGGDNKTTSLAYVCICIFFFLHTHISRFGGCMETNGLIGRHYYIHMSLHERGAHTFSITTFCASKGIER